MNILVAVYSRFDAWNIPLLDVDRLRDMFPQHTFLHARGSDEVTPLIADAEVAFASELRRHHFTAARRLRWVHSPVAGVGGMLIDEVIASPVVISNSRGMSGDTIAEHVLALALALFRRLPLAFRSQASHRWAQADALDPPLRMISGSNVLIIGLGGIGAAAAERFAAMGAVVTGVRRRTDRPAPRGVSKVVAPTEVRAELPAADIVVIAAPQTRSTRALFGEEQLNLMKRDAILINVSRGKLVDEKRLAEALVRGRIGGAGLDVFEREPLDPSSPLWELPTVIITPHVAGFRADHWAAAVEIFAENLRRFEAGTPLLNVVDKGEGY